MNGVEGVPSSMCSVSEDLHCDLLSLPDIPGPSPIDGGAIPIQATKTYSSKPRGRFACSGRREPKAAPQREGSLLCSGQDFPRANDF